VSILAHYSHRDRLLLFVKYVAMCILKVPNKTIHRLENFGTPEMFVCDKFLSSDKRAEITVYRFQAVHPLRQWDTSARIQYCHLFGRFVREDAASK
jgi:hypothetical protein